MITNDKNLTLYRVKVWFHQMEVVALSCMLFKEQKNGYYHSNAF
jgi:hypothetical protein